MRVAVISLYYPPTLSGVSTLLINTAPHFTAAGIDLHIITPRLIDQPAPEAAPGTTLHRLASARVGQYASKRFVFDAVQRLRELRPNVLHTYELLQPTTIGLIAKTLWRIPLVATSITSGELLGDIARMRRAKLGRYRLNALRNQLDHFIGLSRTIDREAESIGIPAERRSVIPSSIDTTRFTPVSAQCRSDLRRQLNLPDAPIVIYTGRLSPEKRLKNLIAVWPQIRAIQPEAVLLLVGSGPEEDHLRAMAGVGVIFIQSTLQVEWYLQTANVFVLPSIAEGMSLSLVEAMATGLPVVITGVGGAQEAIEHGQSGWIVPPDDSSALKDSILNLLGNPDQSAAFGLRARETAIAKFSIESCVQKLLQVYERVSK